MLVRILLALLALLLLAAPALAKNHQGKLPQITSITTALKPATHTIGVRATTKANDYDRYISVTATLGDQPEQQLTQSKNKSVYSGNLEGRYFGAGQRVPLLIRFCGTYFWLQIAGPGRLWQRHEVRCVTRGVVLAMPGNW